MKATEIKPFLESLKGADPFDYMATYTLVDWEFRYDIPQESLERLHNLLSKRFKDQNMRLKQDLSIQELCELLSQKLKELKA